eukprot:s1741_g3.t1
MEPFQNTITKEELTGYLRWAATQVSLPGQGKEIGAPSGSGDGRAAGADSATVEPDKRRSRFCTTHFYTGFERKGNSEGPALSRRSRELPTSTQATLALGKSRPFLLAFSSSVSSAPAIVPPQEVFPWLPYANDNGRLVHEPPPAAPAPSMAADTATPRAAAPPTRRTEVTPHIRLPRSFAEAPSPRGIWSDPAPEPEPTPGATTTPAAPPQPYFAGARMLDMVHSLQLHQGLAMLTASTANPDHSLNETLAFLDNLRAYVADME